MKILSWNKVLKSWRRDYAGIIFIYYYFETDIDECLEKTSGCQQICKNTDGSFKCQCFTGFSLNSDTTTCSRTGTSWNLILRKPLYNENKGLKKRWFF